MSVANVSLLGMLKTRMHWQQARQQVLSQDVANADTPGFVAKDLKPLDFGTTGPASVSRLVVTDPRHIQALADDGAGGAASDGGDSFATAAMGSDVSLEDQLMQVSQNVTDFQMVSDLYSEGLGLIRTAVGS